MKPAQPSDTNPRPRQESLWYHISDLDGTTQIEVDKPPQLESHTTRTMAQITRELEMYGLDISVNTPKVQELIHRKKYLVPLGIGGEGAAYYYSTENEKGEIERRVIKCFHDMGDVEDLSTIENDDEKAPVNRFGKIVRSVVNNARFASSIYNLEGVTELVNRRTDQLMQNEVFKLLYSDLLAECGTTEDIHNQQSCDQFCDWLEWHLTAHMGISNRVMQEHIQPRMDQLKDTLFPSLDDMISNGEISGMAEYLNAVFLIVEESFPDEAFWDKNNKTYYLGLPFRMMPNINMFGKFEDDFAQEELRGQVFLDMEYTPTILQKTLEENAEKAASQVQRLSRVLGEDAGKYNIPDFVKNNFPEHLFNQYVYLLQILHCFDLVFCDPGVGNFAKDEYGQPILIDPASIQLRGSIQRICKLEYLSEEEQELAVTGQLIADPNRDLDVIELIIEEMRDEHMNKTEMAKKNTEQQKFEAKSAILMWEGGK